jgi:hypothetical protein
MTSSSLSSLKFFTLPVSDRFTASLQVSTPPNRDVQLNPGYSPGAIIGVTVGIVLLIVGIITLILFLHRQQTEESTDFIEDETELNWSGTESLMSETGSLCENELEHEYENPLAVHQEGIDDFSADADPFQFGPVE